MNKAKRLKIDIHTDGGCFPNPGGPGGCAFIVICKEENIYQEGSFHYRSTTNNRMELMAFLKAMEWIIENIGHKFDYTWYSDSKYALNCVRDWMWTWKEKPNWGNKKNVDILKQIIDTVKYKGAIYQWVKGHSGEEYNEACDQMCLDAVLNNEPLIDDGYHGPSKEFIAPELISKS